MPYFNYLVLPKFGSSLNDTNGLKKITFLFCLAFLRYVFKIKMDGIKVMSIFKQEAHRLDGHLSTVTNAKLLTDNGRPTAIGNPCDLKKTCSLYGHIFPPPYPTSTKGPTL